MKRPFYRKALRPPAFFHKESPPSFGARPSCKKQQQKGACRKSSFFSKNSGLRKGGIVVIAIMMIALSTFTIATDFYRDIVQHYMAVRSQGEGFRARSLALAGFQAGLAALKIIPEEFLYTKGMVLNPPDIEMDRECDEDGENCTYLYLSYRILPEDGKLNLNNVILTADEPNENYRKILLRFFQQFQETMETEEIDLDTSAEQRVNAIIDWIDLNNNEYGDGAEAAYYSSLKPPRKIKNGPMFDLTELAVVRGFNKRIVYDPIIDPEWKENREDRASMTDEEKDMLQDADFVLANNLTVYLPYEGGINDKININSARYHVLMSLSPNMTKEAVLALFKLRRKKQGYIKNLSALQELPEFLITSPETGLNLYQELVGTGGDISGMLKTQGAYYRVVGVGSIVRQADNQEDNNVLAVRRVWGIYEKATRRLVYYAED